MSAIAVVLFILFNDVGDLFSPSEHLSLCAENYLVRRRQIG